MEEQLNQDDKNKQSVTLNDHPLWLKIIIGLCLVIVISLGFYFLPYEYGYDFSLLLSGPQRLLQGESPYIRSVIDYLSPPWITVSMLPFALLPFKVSLAILNTLTLLSGLLLAHRYKLGFFRTFLLLMSPPLIFALWLGQIDLLVLLTLFLPMELWFLGALGKPQVAFGMGFAVLRKPHLWLKTIMFGLGILAITVLLYGWWPGDILAQASEADLSNQGHNFFAGFWPFQLIAGLGILSVAWERDDERLYIASSPFLFSYAASYSFFPTLLAAFSMMKRWQCAIIWATWWGAIIYRAING